MKDFYGGKAVSFVKKLPIRDQQLIEAVRQKRLKKWIHDGKVQVYHLNDGSRAYKTRFSFDDFDTGKRIGYWLYFYQRVTDGEIVLIDVK